MSPARSTFAAPWRRTYFEGFKRVENRGTYATPIGDASEVQVVRGPPNPIMGAGKVGGLLNFIPKTAKDAGAYIQQPTGEIDLTGGSYDKKEATVQGGAPVSIGGLQGGLYGYSRRGRQPQASTAASIRSVRRRSSRPTSTCRAGGPRHWRG